MVNLKQDWELAAPRADALIESTRGFGYSPETAIADLVDNSISAKAKLIRVDFEWAGTESAVTVRDDGRGMTEDQLSSAMRLGSTSPLEDRARSDLGRFGLGMKTASFSQARELTVVSKTASAEDNAVRRWDLDTVARTGEWRLHTTHPPTRPSSVDSETGTTVLWTKLDRLVGDAAQSDRRAHSRFLDVADRVHAHLGATFHRFLVGRSSVKIQVNGKEVIPWDPFMSDHPATQHLPHEDLPFRGELIRVGPYVLPHRSKLSEEQAKNGAGIHGWNHHQGFYIYRSNRLLILGDWLGLGFARDEHTKLARIAIEFPAKLDHDWQVDVKKSTARPPGEIADSLKRIAQSTRTRAEEVYRHRGKIIAQRTSKDFVFAWHQVKDREGKVRYSINRKHPVISALISQAGDKKRTVERALRFIEETVPTTMIGVAIADSLDNQHAPYAQSSREVKPLADFVFRGLIEDGARPADALDRLASSEPFTQFPEVIASLKEKML